MKSPRERPEAVGSVLNRLLESTGLSERVDQASVIPEWPHLVGPQIAQVTEPLSVTAAGMLFVAVRTNAWMNELSLMEPELLRALNTRPERPSIRKIRWVLQRP